MLYKLEVFCYVKSGCLFKGIQNFKGAYNSSGCNRQLLLKISDYFFSLVFTIALLHALALERCRIL